jgi:uncharacterized protein YbjT (DUF2867 family)
MLGSEICLRLARKGLPVRALVRPGAAGRDRLTQAGVETCTGDLKDRRSLESACRGVSAVVTTANAMISRRRGDSLRTVDRDGHLALVDTARDAGASRFVYVSVTPRLAPGPPLVTYKRQVEAAVRSSGMSWTILQPAAFMEISLGPIAGWDPARRRAMILGPGTTPVSYVSSSDVATIAVRSLSEDGFANRSVPIGGPEALTALQVVRLFESATGGPFAVTHIPIAVARSLAVLLRFVDPVHASILGMATQMAMSGDIIEVKPSREGDHPEMTTVSAYVAKAAGSSVARPHA